MSISEIQKQTEYKMNRTVETLREDFIKIRTGRASTGLLDHVMVDYYGTMTPINQVAQVGVADARTLTVQPWEKTMVAPIEKAIRSSDLGLNPATSGMLIRVPLPPLTEERRRDLTKVVRHLGEEAKVAVRNLRRDANEQIKKLKNIITDQQEEIIKYQNNQALPGVKDPQNGTILTTSEQVQQTMNRLWDLYQSFCERLQRLEPEF